MARWLFYSAETMNRNRNILGGNPENLDAKAALLFQNVAFLNAIC